MPFIRVWPELAMDITELPVQWSEGDRAALDRLAPIVYDELVRLARLRLSVLVQSY
jgi:hypothetical protein